MATWQPSGNLNCPFCLKYNSDMIIQQCGHMICRTCQVKFGRETLGKDVHCRICEIVQKNSQVVPVICAPTPENFCQQCSHVGTWRNTEALCTSCKKAYCNECINNHAKEKAFMNHTFLRHFCTKHGKEFEYICKTCVVVLCVECVLAGQHKNHDVQQHVVNIDSNTDYLQARRDLENKIQKATETLDGFAASIKHRFDEWDRAAVKDLNLLVKLRNEINEAIKKHPSNAKEGTDAIKQTYDAGIMAGRGEIEHGKHLLNTDENEFLLNMDWVDKAIDTGLGSVKESLNSLPSIINCCDDFWLLEGLNKTMEHVRLSQYHSDLSKMLEQLRNTPKRVENVECKLGQSKTCSISVKQNGSALVCTNHRLYEICTDGTIFNLHDELGYWLNINTSQNSQAPSPVTIRVYGKDIYIMMYDGKLLKTDEKGTVTEITGPTLRWIVHGWFCVDGDIAYFLDGYALTKRSLSLERNSDAQHVMSSSSYQMLEPIFHDGSMKLITFQRGNGHVVVINGNTISHSFPCGVKAGTERLGGMTVMADGRILIGHPTESRIMQYSIGGTYLGDLLKGDQLPRQLLGISYRHPCLWVVGFGRPGQVAKIEFPDASGNTQTVKEDTYVILFRFDK